MVKLLDLTLIPHTDPEPHTHPPSQTVKGLGLPSRAWGAVREGLERTIAGERGFGNTAFCTRLFTPACCRTLRYCNPGRYLEAALPAEVKGLGGGLDDGAFTPSIELLFVATKTCERA
jgi:hypothetical protein